MTELKKEPNGDSHGEEPQLFEENHEKNRFRKRNILLLAILLVSAFLIWPRAALQVEGVLQAEKFARLGLTSSGVLKELLREKGERLKEGDLIAKFENSELLKRYEQAKLELGKLEDERVILNERLKQLDKEKERMRILFENGAAGKIRLESADFEFFKATREFVILEKRIQSAKRELQFLDDEIKSLELKAPFDGVLLTDPSDTIGSPIQKGEFVLEMADPDTYFIEIMIPEEDVEKIGIGSKVKAKFYSFPGKTYQGRVVRLSPRTTQEVEKVFKIRHVVPCEIKLDDFPENLRYGMHARVKIHSKTKGVF